MAKTDFSKVEEALIEGLRKMKVLELLELADEVAGISSEEGKGEEKRRLAAHALGHTLSFLRKKDPKIYSSLGIKKEQADKLLQSDQEISEENWKEIKVLKEKIDAMREEITATMTDEELIEHERERHKKKRFNVSEKWLPLD